jgi:SAM-dependent methyltransferase
MTTPLIRISQVIFPAPLRSLLWARWKGQEYRPPVGRVRFGDLRRVKPISRLWGYDRGLPIDRYYIERFLNSHAESIHGHVMEIGDATYTCKFGGDRVIQSDVLHVTEGNPQATIVADLTCADHIPSNTFDCIILTQTLHLIFKVEAALQTLYRILKPGGVVLATFPGISHISRREEKDSWGDQWFWSFTTQSARLLFERVFPASCIQVNAYGNVLAAVAFLHGLASQEMRPEELDYRDNDYDMLVAIRAVKPERPVENR